MVIKEANIKVIGTWYTIDDLKTIDSYIIAHAEFKNRSDFIKKAITHFLECANKPTN